MGQWDFGKSPMGPGRSPELSGGCQLDKDIKVWKAYLEVEDAQRGLRLGVPMWTKSVAQLLYDRKLKEANFYTLDASDNRWTANHFLEVQNNLINIFGLGISNIASGVNSIGRNWWFWKTKGVVNQMDLQLKIWALQIHNFYGRPQEP